jgi:sec-independent protein translocase protein TatC
MSDVALMKSADEPEESHEPEEGTMGFLDHLEELRRRIFYVVGFVFIAFIVCWGFSSSLYRFLSKPVSEALIASRLQSVKSGVKLASLKDVPDGSAVTFIFSGGVTIQGAVVPAGTAVPARIVRDEKGARALETAQTVVIGDRVIPEKFVLPASNLFSDAIDPTGQLVVHTVQGAFNLYLKVAFYAAIFFSIPFALYQIYGFIAPGLYKHERGYIWPVLIMGTGFFLLGSAFGYYIAFPRACAFLLDTAKDFQAFIEVNDYFDLIIAIVLGLGIVFELPTIVFVLARIGLVTGGFLLKVWRLALIGIFILAAIISPTSDIPNMLVFAVPMMILYFLSVGIAFVFGRERHGDDEEAAAA